MTATPIKLTPLHAAAQRLNAQFTEAAGWRVPRVYTSVEQEMAAARSLCALGDVTPHGKVQIEGAEAAAAIRAALGDAPEEIGRGIPVESGHVYRLRRDMFYLSTPPSQERDALSRLEAALRQAPHFVTVTDVTHGLADLRLVGPASRTVLSKLCGLDFHPDVFPDMMVKQTSLAKTKQMLIRRDFEELPAYNIIGAQSLAVYLWSVILEAGHEFGIAPVGAAAMASLEAA